MGYIGNQQTEGYSQAPSKQDLTGATGGTLTLTHAVSSSEAIDLYINHVRQEPTSSYSIVGTTVTLNGYTVVASDDIYVVYNSLALQTTVAPDASVSTAKIIDGAVTSAKLDTNIDVAGTLDSTGVITADAGIKLGTGTDILSSYDEGTWTPVLYTASGTAATYTSQIGVYTKIGNLVYIYFDIAINAINNSNNTQVRGQPFNSINNDVLAVSYFSGLNVSPYSVTFQCIGTNGFMSVGVNSAGVNIYNGMPIFKDGARIIASGCYRTLG
ncbi:hypothetical protein OAT17_00785 [Flavobacteriaceae bacterium]|nr:hypothetical protein [Flavobacteriaceae bacterium]